MNFESFGILGDLAEVFSSLSLYLSNLWDTLFEGSIGQMLVDNGYDTLASLLPKGIYDSTLGLFILSSGLATYLIISLVKWFIGIFT